MSPTGTDHMGPCCHSYVQPDKQHLTPSQKKSLIVFWNWKKNQHDNRASCMTFNALGRSGAASHLNMKSSLHLKNWKLGLCQKERWLKWERCYCPLGEKQFNNAHLHHLFSQVLLVAFRLGELSLRCEARWWGWWRDGEPNLKGPTLSPWTPHRFSFKGRKPWKPCREILQPSETWGKVKLRDLTRSLFLCPWKPCFNRSPSKARGKWARAVRKEESRIEVLRPDKWTILEKITCNLPKHHSLSNNMPDMHNFLADIKHPVPTT